MATLEKMTPSSPGSAVERFQKEDSRCSAKHRSRMQQEQGKGREFEIHIEYIRIQIAEQSGIHHRSWWPDQRCLTELQGVPQVVALPIRSGIWQSQERGDCRSDCQRGGKAGVQPVLTSIARIPNSWHSSAWRRESCVRLRASFRSALAKRSWVGWSRIWRVKKF